MSKVKNSDWNYDESDAKVVTKPWGKEIWINYRKGENIGDEECGTEFAPEGLQSNQRFFCPPFVGRWVIYPAEWMHRPGLLKSEDTRMIVAADLGFIDAT